MNDSTSNPTTAVLDRRKFITAGGIGVLSLAAIALPLTSVSGKSASTLPASKMPRPFTRGFVVPPVLQPLATTVDRTDGSLIKHFEVTEKASTQEFIQGIRTTILGYEGVFPGPTIDLDQGTKARLTVRNHLPKTTNHAGHNGSISLSTSTHLHGSASLPQYDGYANDITPPGFKKEYHYPNFQPARTLWYHDHGVHITAQNVYGGLAAMYKLHDPAERSILPQGEFDVPLVVSDIMFDAKGNTLYDDHSHSGLWGDIILVNGVPWPTMNVKKRIYRFRFLAAGISRSFKFRLSTREPLTVVATDGGMLAKAAPVATFRQGVAERYEVLIDFSKYKKGTEIILENLSNPNNIDYANTNKVMRFVVTDDAFTTNDPGALVMPNITSHDPLMTLSTKESVKTRKMVVKKGAGDIWAISDTSWAEIEASGFEKVWADPDLNDVEIWEIENKSGGWFHPIHIHLIDFRILSRNGRPPFAWENGPKDVVYVGEGETVRLLMKFQYNRGKYMIHCHNLPHEDHDMMVQFSVGLKKGDPDPNNPITAAPPVPDPTAA